jgi:hypothetical protein
MKIMVRLLVAGLLVGGLQAGAPVPSFDEKNLQFVAEGKGYGYKYGNLAELKALTEWFNKQAGASKLLVQVPEFFGISTTRIEALLSDRGFNVAAKWAEVIATVAEGQRAKVMDSKQLPDAFWTAQRTFITDLSTAFEAMMPKLLEQKFNDDALSGSDSKADELIATVAANRDVLMVRSTGKEDTRTMANAGGNESIANVDPKPAAIWEAIKAVVLSYFGEKSLKQRLGLGDESLFDKEVFCPVLVQRMIGETDAAKPPVCGVMFTEEAEGGISWKEVKKATLPDAEDDPEAAIKTTGITIIQAAYGHNEGVVNSLVVVDTVIAQNIDGAAEPVFYPVIRAKRERLVPVAGQSKLEFKPNPKELILQSALTNSMLVTLKKFADALEQYYGYPMDVEFVVRDEIVYVVQARPIVHKAERAEPSYLSDLKRYGKEHVFKGRTIGTAGGSVVEILNKAECIMVPTIGMALSMYQASSESNSIKAIIVGADAPATSHEATTFRSEGKPVIFIQDLEKLKEEFVTDKKLVFSPQQHCVVVMPQAEVVAHLPGWCAYPLPAEISIVPALFLNAETKPKASVMNKRGKLTPLSWSALLEQMKKEPKPGVIAAVEQFRVQLFAALHKLGKGVVHDGDLQKQNALLQKAVGAICDRIVLLADIGQEDELYIKRLLPILYLEALVYQQVRGNDVLEPLSIERVVGTLKREQQPSAVAASSHAAGLSSASASAAHEAPRSAEATAAAQPEAGEPFGDQLARAKPRVSDIAKKAVAAFTAKGGAKAFATQLKQVEQIIFDEETAAAWLAVITAITTNSPDLAGPLGMLVRSLQGFDLLPMWLHTVMVRDVQAAQAGGALTNDVLHALIKKWVDPLKASGEFLNQIKLLSERITAFQPNGFDTPSKFNAMWSLLEALLADVMKPELAANFKGVNATAKFAACFMLTKFIDLFDRCIKTMKGSNNYKTDEKLKRFQQMLKASNTWLVYVFKAFVPSGAIHNASLLPDYIKMTTDLVNKAMPTETDLLPTSGVDVFNFSIGSVHQFTADTHENKQPASLEDVFSIIHQSLMNGIAACVVSNNVSDFKRPELLTKIEAIFKTQLDEAGGRAPSPTLVGVEARNDGITVLYNQPLGAHGCQIALRYRHKTKDVVIELHFAGGVVSERHRWYSGALLTVLAGRKADLATNLKPRLVALSNHTLIVTFTLSTSDAYTHLEKLWKELLCMATSFNIDSIIGSYEPVEINSKDLEQLKQFGDIGYAAIMGFYSAMVGTKADSKHYQESLEKANMLIGLGDENSQVESIAIFSALISKSYQPAYVHAANAAEIGLKVGVPCVTQTSLSIFDSLVRNGNEALYPQGLLAACYASSDSHDSVTIEAYRLFDSLLEKNYVPAYQQAFKIASAWSHSINSNLLLQSKDLLATLIDKDYVPAYQKAIEVAAASVSSLNDTACEKGHYLFVTLIDKNYGPAFSAATKFAKELFARRATKTLSQVSYESDALVLFSKLIEKRHAEAYDKAMKIASLPYCFEKLLLGDKSVNIFKQLIDAGYDPAYAAVAEILSNGSAKQYRRKLDALPKKPK